MDIVCNLAPFILLNPLKNFKNYGITVYIEKVSTCTYYM